MGKIITILFLIGIALILSYAILAILKNNNTYKNRRIILDAIHLYSMDCLKNNRCADISYTDMEEYDTTLYRWWDWGYTRILPECKFDLIKPYIKE